ncbi:MAG: AAA family ATPase [Promethearchaeota archaeon]
MIITKVELENITTHKKTLIEFQEGLNVLIGQNGSGKSTILNMIGYNLFDFLPGAQKDYLRNDYYFQPKFGTIAVWIVGLNDDQFIIKRTLGKPSNDIEVLDAFTGVTISGVNNKTSLQEWLKNQISLKEGFDLAHVFKTSIGVPQGTFTVPFLQTPRNRKAFFDPILQVDVYRKVWENFLDVIKLISEDIHLHELKASELKGILSQSDDLRNEKEAINKKIDVVKKEENQLQKDLKLITEDFNDQKKVKEKIGKLKTVYEKLELKRENLIQARNQINEDIKETKEAQEICTDTNDDYIKYEKLILKEASLQKSNQSLQETKDEKNKLEHQLTKIKSLDTLISQQIKNIEDSQKDFKILTKDFQKSQEFQVEIENLQKKLANISSQEELLDRKKDDYTKLSIGIDEKEGKLEEIPNLEKKVDMLDNLRDKLQEIESQRVKFETEITQFDKSKTDSKGGNCPIFKIKCKNFEEALLEQHFHDLIVENQKLLKPILIEKKIIREEIKDLKKLQIKLESLRKTEIEIKTLKKQRLQIGKEIQGLQVIVRGKQAEEDKLTELKSKKLALEDKVSNYIILKHDIEVNLPELYIQLKDTQQELPLIVKKLQPIKDKIKSLEDIPNKIKLLQEEMNKTRKNHSKYQESIKIAEKLPSLTKKLNQKIEELKQIEKKLENEVLNRKKLEDQFDNEKFLNSEKRKNELNDSIKVIEGTIKTHRKRISEIDTKFKTLEAKERELKDMEEDIRNLNDMKQFSETMRIWYNEIGPKITEVLLKKINGLASEIYRDLMDVDNTQLNWEKDYNVKILTSNNEKNFHQLSGGEQMAAALSVRLAILKILTNVDFAFFDEPTINLDKERRISLAKCIQNIKGFRQLFVISHDDTFEENAENMIRFTKDDSEITTVEYFRK